MFAGRQTVVSTAFTAFTPQLVFNTLTLAVMPVYGLMIAFPKTQLVRVQLAGPALCCNSNNNNN
jgi:hypothetical protein